MPFKNEIAKPILYVFLLPFVSQENKYIIKIGYTTNIIKRHKELKTEFDVNEIKLLYCYLIDGEHTELNVHKNLKNTFNINIFNMKKNKKLELKKINNELELKKSDNDIELKKMELKKSDNDIELKKIELKKSDNYYEQKNMEY